MCARHNLVLESYQHMTVIGKTKLPLFPVRLELWHYPDADCCGNTSYCNTGIITVKLRTMDDATIVHEALHVVQFAQKHLGTTFDDETASYMTEWIFTFCQTKVKDYLYKTTDLGQD